MKCASNCVIRMYIISVSEDDCFVKFHPGYVLENNPVELYCVYRERPMTDIRRVTWYKDDDFWIFSGSILKMESIERNYQAFHRDFHFDPQTDYSEYHGIKLKSAKRRDKSRYKCKVTDVRGNTRTSQTKEFVINYRKYCHTICTRSIISCITCTHYQIVKWRYM